MENQRPKKVKWLRARSDEQQLRLVQLAAAASDMDASDFIRTTVLQRARSVLASQTYALSGHALCQ